MRCLIVEDDTKLALFLSRALNEEGYTADICGRGVDAISQVHGGGYDFVILDWMLPGMDGLAVCRELRQRGLTIPIIMLTARGEVGERVLAARAPTTPGKPPSRGALGAHPGLRARPRPASLPSGIWRSIARTPRQPRRKAHRSHHARVRPLPTRLQRQSGGAAQLFWPKSGNHLRPASNPTDVHIKRLRDKLASIVDDRHRARAGYRLKAPPPAP
jgi:two-component system OmpR family response regulator